MGFTGSATNPVASDLDSFYDRAINCYSSASYTKLTQLVIQSNMHFEQYQVMKLLGLEEGNEQHAKAFEYLLNLIEMVAKRLIQDGVTNLFNAPLTNIQYLSYIIAKEMPYLFFVPVEKRIKQTYEEDFLDSDLKVLTSACRFNENWIITYLLKEAFSAIKNCGSCQ
ncbi:uncharacterized protein J8A68_004838 [[Candida] subhashii]|uniref:Uncharacterized protein n=1 Tax=[Candida] subhashii TaxID=561895 RepID=A0A8J5UUH5_9ASCO|nr:uncharacterized protein J8A68_004838 [[Candida] subhashii]KAG7661685.1 hypothetical protein J8A68_004838 [[Candida] subhashii]